MIDEIILTEDGRYITIMEIDPINYSYKSAEDKARIISSFAAYTRVAPIKFRIKTISRRSNVDKYVRNLQEEFSKDNKNKYIKNYQKDYISLVKQLGNKEGVERHFYLILEFVETETTPVDSEYDIVSYLRRARTTAERFLRNCGNEVIHPENEFDFALEVVSNIANKEGNDLWYRYHDTKDQLVSYYNNDEEKILEARGYYNNLCAPRQITFDRDYCVVDNVYYTFLLIPSAAYPEHVGGAWMSFLFNYCEGLDVDIFVEKKPTQSMKNKVRQRARINTARLNHTNSEGDNLDELVNSIRASNYLKDALSSGEEFFYFATLITISDTDPAMLERKQIAIRETLNGLDMAADELPYKMEECLSAYQVCGYLPPKIFDKGKRNATTSGFSSLYPFASFEVSDDDGILLGISQDNSSMVVSDNFNTKKYSNANMVIFGTSGAGKTFTLQTICMRYRLKGVQVFTIIPEKGEEFYPATKAIGGTYINISSGSTNRINIMEIRPNLNYTLEEDEDDSTFSLRGRRRSVILLNQKIESLSTFFSLILSDMNLEERQLLDEAIINTYAKKGITKDNASLLDHYEYRVIDGKKVKFPVFKEMPILEDLYNELRKDPLTNRLANILNRYVNGSASTFNGQTNVDLDNKYVIVDITDLSEELKPVGMYVALEYIWDKVKEDKTKKKIIAIDEAWKLISENELAANFMKKIFKTIRGYAGAAIAATQDIKDFFALNNGAYGEAIINNSRIKLLFKLEPKEAQTIQKVFDLSDSERETITMFGRGQALIKANSNTFTIDYKASKYETLLVTTDRTILAKIERGEDISENDLKA